MRAREVAQQASRRLSEAGIASADAEAWLLLAHVLGTDVSEVRRRDVLGESLDAESVERYTSLVDERARRVPLQHLTGVAPFRHLEVKVGPGVFVPRPETEMLVDAVIEHAPQGGRVVDLCTGSGAIALAVKAERPDLEVIAVEVDESAAAWTARNIKNLDLTVELRVEDARKALEGLEGCVDVVVSNPPYVPTGMVPVDPEVAEHDPEVALYGGSGDGLRFPLQIAERAAHLLRAGGILVMEHADVQGEALPASLLDRRGYEWAVDHVDAAGKPRMTVARREGGSRFETPSTPQERPFRRRATVRLVVVDDDGRVLVYEDSDQGTTPPATWWSTPGGGIDPGEDERHAAVRELAEETGAHVEACEFVGPIARRTVVHGYSDQVVEQHDVFYGLRIAAFDVAPDALTPEEELTMQQWRWCSPDELTALGAPLWPAQLPDLVSRLLTSGEDGAPIDLPDVEESTVAASLGHRA